MRLNANCLDSLYTLDVLVITSPAHLDWNILLFFLPVFEFDGTFFIERWGYNKRQLQKKYNIEFILYYKLALSQFIIQYGFCNLYFYLEPDSRKVSD